MADPTISSGAGGLFNTSDSTAASATASVSVTGVSDKVTAGGLFKGQASDSIQQEFASTLSEIETFANQALESATTASAAQTAAETAETNAENLVNGLGLGSTGFDLSGISEGDGVVMGNNDTLVAHTFTTTSLSDVDNTNRQNGSVLVYNTTSNKYISTNTIEENMTIKGGTF